MKRRRWFELHSWLGVVSGLLLFVICWSGTTAVLSREIDWLLDARQRVEVPASPERASWGALLDAVRRAHPNATDITLRAPLYSGFSAQADVELPGAVAAVVHLDPYRAEVLGTGSRLTVQRFFRDLHMCLFDVGNDYGGYWVVGVFGIALLVSTATPLLFYRRWWRGFTTLKTTRGARVFWSDAHKLAGVWSLVFALLIAFTAIWYLVEWADPIAYLETPRFESSPRMPLKGAALDALVARGHRTWPELAIRSVGTPEGSYWGDVVTLEGQAQAWLVRDRSNRLMLDARTGEVAYEQRAEALAWPARWIDTADPLHFGDFGGLLSKLAWFVFGLLLSGMSLSGAYLHAQRLRSTVVERARVRGASIANVASLAILGFSAVLAVQSVGADLPSTPGGGSVQVATGIVLFLVAWTIVTLGTIVWLIGECGHRTKQAVRSRE